ncbi:MAG: PQQ-binding-like beta-propeller repeat protein, partial [candidate division Zixibacteria bacterium]|nr:PQQ-binding-like beta-propeller repeat protein [candidate division Zixibacteria bacterium]
GKYKTRANVQTGLTVVDSLAYFASGPVKNLFVCLNLHNRKTLWRTKIKDVTGAPIIKDNRVYLASDLGWVECRDRLSGEIIWRDSVGAKSPAGPSLDEGVIYFPFDDGRLIGFDEKTGDMIVNVDLKQPLVSKVAIDGMIFISGMAGTFSALEKESGEIIWERSFEWPIWTSPAIDENMVYVGDNGGLLRALDRKDGRTLWSFRADGVILSAPISVGKYLVFASLDKYLYCVDKTTGLLNSKWKNDREIRFPAISDGESIYVISQDGLISCLGD